MTFRTNSKSTNSIVFTSSMEIFRCGLNVQLFINSRNLPMNVEHVSFRCLFVTVLHQKECLNKFINKNAVNYRIESYTNIFWNLFIFRMALKNCREAIMYCLTSLVSLTKTRLQKCLCCAGIWTSCGIFLSWV